MFFISIFIFEIYLFNIIQHNITINLTITRRKKGRETVKKQTNKQTKSEIGKFNRLTTTGRTNRKITIARLC